MEAERRRILEAAVAEEAPDMPTPDLPELGMVAFAEAASARLRIRSNSRIAEVKKCLVTSFTMHYHSNNID